MIRFVGVSAVRVQAHFDSVISELTAAHRDLSPMQLHRRLQLIAELGKYRDRGQFPHNYDVPDRAVPTFVDPRTGVRCASPSFQVIRRSCTGSMKTG